jgi:hypothetical protein
MGIEKDSLRIGTNSMMGDHVMTSWNHLACFKLPRTSGNDLEGFLVGLTGFCDMAADTQSEIHEKLTATMSSSKTSRGSESYAFTFLNTFHLAVKKRGGKADDAERSDEDEVKIKSKKSKASSSSDDPVFDKYNSMSIESLKDRLRWNNQPLKGTKVCFPKKALSLSFFSRNLSRSVSTERRTGHYLRVQN